MTGRRVVSEPSDLAKTMTLLMTPVPVVENYKNKRVIDIPRLSDAYRRKARLGNGASDGIGHIYSLVHAGYALARANHWYEPCQQSGRIHNAQVFQEKLSELGHLARHFHDAARVILPLARDRIHPLLAGYVDADNALTAGRLRFRFVFQDKIYRPDDVLRARTRIDDERHRETAFMWQSFAFDDAGATME